MEFSKRDLNFAGFEILLIEYMKLTQNPPSGKHTLFFRGDIAVFELSLDMPAKGKAFLRTNLGNAVIQRGEIIESVETKRPKSGQDWHDIQMFKDDGKKFTLSIALIEVGHFEAKCFFLPENTTEPVWTEGDNLHINVEPADYCCANSIYCAFIRQFGINANNPVSLPIIDVDKNSIKKLDGAGFTVIPPSGTFRSFMRRLDFITDTLHSRIIHLLPINPTPTVYARMGRYGSPYASLDFTAVDPAFAEFDTKATPLDQFLELVDAIHRKNARIFLDIAINHTGWAAKIHEEHPEWLVREKDGSIHSPGAWGNTWGDLTELNHYRLDLWQYLSEVFLIWCGRGVDGFRCDAGYMIPVQAWQYIIARVRNQFSNTIFLLEGLGGDPAVTRQLLDIANMNWAYSELFQNYTKEQIEGYVPFAQQISFSDGLMVNYAETHDNNRLAAVSPVYARMRTALCALTSSNGTFGFTNGVEWFATEKIDVHEANALNWDNKFNQVSHIARLNAILLAHPAFHNHSSIRFIESGHSKALAFIRFDPEKKTPLLVLINLDCDNPSKTIWHSTSVPFQCQSLLDLITGESFTPTVHEDVKYSLVLAPGQFLCLTADAGDLKMISAVENGKPHSVDRVEFQRARANALDLMCWKNRSKIIFEEDLSQKVLEILEDPFEFCEKLFKEGNSSEVPVVLWEWPRDLKREVMIPPGHIFLITAPHRFHAAIADSSGVILMEKNCIQPRSNGSFFVLFPPLPDSEKHTGLKLIMSVYSEIKSRRESSALLLLSTKSDFVKAVYDNIEIRESNRTFLATNRRGGMLRACLKWGELSSRYDALLAGNLNPEYPEDRHVMWRRCRLWAKHHGRIVPFSVNTIEKFVLEPDGSGTWIFHLPVGNGRFVDISITALMVDGKNAVSLNISRLPLQNDRLSLADNIPVTLIVRPDIEDRNFHHETRAMSGPEHAWPGAITPSAKSFTFAPCADRSFMLSTFKGRFIHKPEWIYSVYQPNEAARGLEPCTDMFSPGYFEIEITANECDQMLGQILTPLENKKIQVNICRLPPEPVLIPLEKCLLDAMKKFIVRREKHQTIIAGYPWFLDWGRDTLICTRGLIAANMLDEAADIIKLFAKFEENGTLPNMIHGNNSGNRDTTDAPLWLFVSCRDFIGMKKDKDILSEKLSGKRTVLEALISIAENYMNGTPNGIKAEEKSGLVFSPAHFTWMDTNFPAGTPREGFPVEIQALWYSALQFLYEHTNDDKWKEAARKVKKSFKEYFIYKDGVWLYDCLHAKYGQPASMAIPDDSLRPNQLLAITLRLLDGNDGDHELCGRILRAVSSLLIPGAIRSLADRPVNFHNSIYLKDGALINDPANPYWGRYEGSEDTRRKPAYHNGTAWTWLFPSYSEAYLMTYGELSRNTALSILDSSKLLLENGCVGNIPEILDGDFPHTQKGCDAQAWGVTELYRVWKMLH